MLTVTVTPTETRKVTQPTNFCLALWGERTKEPPKILDKSWIFGGSFVSGALYPRGMKSSLITALTIAAILGTATAAMAVNADTLKGIDGGTIGNAIEVLVPIVSGTESSVPPSGPTSSPTPSGQDSEKTSPPVDPSTLTPDENTGGSSAGSSVPSGAAESNGSGSSQVPQTGDSSGDVSGDSSGDDGSSEPTENSSEDDD